MGGSGRARSAASLEASYADASPLDQALQGAVAALGQTESGERVIPTVRPRGRGARPHPHPDRASSSGCRRPGSTRSSASAARPPRGSRPPVKDAARAAVAAAAPPRPPVVDDPSDPTDQVSGGVPPLEDPTTGEPPIAPAPVTTAWRTHGRRRGCLRGLRARRTSSRCCCPTGGRRSGTSSTTPATVSVLALTRRPARGAGPAVPSRPRPARARRSRAAWSTPARTRSPPARASCAEETGYAGRLGRAGGQRRPAGRTGPRHTRAGPRLRARRRSCSSTSSRTSSVVLAPVTGCASCSQRTPAARPSRPTSRSTTPACSRNAQNEAESPSRMRSHPTAVAVGSEHGPADLRDRERVRRHVHVQGPAAPEPRRGRALPVPQGGQLGAQQQRLPPQRRAALPRRRQPPRVRDPRVRRRRRARHPRQGGGAGPRGTARSTPSSGCTTRASPATIYLFKNNTDSAGNSYGCHENYLVGRAGEFSRLADILIPFLVTRQIVVGAGKVTQTPRGAIYSRQPARRAHLGGRLQRHDPQPADHQHPRRAARRRREVPPPARHRRRLQHERDDHDAQGRHLRPGAADDRGGRGDARPHDGEPDPGDPRDLPRRHRAPQGEAGQRARGQRARHPGASTSRKARDFVDRREISTPIIERALDLWERGLKAVESDDLGLVDREIDWVIKWKLIDRYRAKHGLPLGHARDRPARPRLPRHPPQPRPLLPAREARCGRPRDHRPQDLRGQVGAAADHPGPAARRVHPQGPGEAARLHRRLGAPQAQRPGPAHRPVQGPVPLPTTSGSQRLIDGM